MLDSSKRYRQLQDQVRQYQKYAKPKEWINKYFIWVLVLLVFPLVFLSTTIQLTYGILLGIVLVFAVVVGSVIRILERKSRIYQLDTDDWLVYYSFLINDNLEKSRKSKKTELKKEYRKTAIQACHDFLAIIKRDWKVGNFKIAKSTFGGQISEFKSNL